MSEETTTMEELTVDAIDSSFETFKDEDDPWEKARKYKEEKTVLTVTLADSPVKGGVVTDLNGIRGFIPASQLSLGHVEDLNEYSNKEVQAIVKEADESKKRLILSVRDVLRAAAAEAAAAKLAAMEPGSVVEGTVDSIKPFGAFIKIEEGITGLVHVSQISVKRIKDPSVVLKLGDTVKAKVLKVENGKLSLSIKALTAPESAAQEEDTSYPRDYKLPKAEPTTQNLGSLFKGIKFSD